MSRKNIYRFLLLILAVLPQALWGQELPADTPSQQAGTDTVSVFSPVLGISYGVMNFRGDVRNEKLSPGIGLPGFSINISAPVDKKQYYTANFYFLKGRLGGNSYSYSDLTRNLNFQTSVTQIGGSFEYRFDHFVPRTSLIRPYVSLGLASLNFSSKSDMLDEDGNAYYYWDDGTIRFAPETVSPDAPLLYRDYQYETDLRLYEAQEHGLGDYGQNTLVIPIGLGAHFKITDRARMSLGVAFNFTFTDLLDNVAAEGTSIVGNKRNDHYIYSHVGFHFDLFAPRGTDADLLFGDSEFDEMLYEDEDGDQVSDMTDHCIGTPYGLEVDSTGCPLDGDKDGVPDYIDLELDTQPDAWVDDFGVTVAEEQYMEALELRGNAMDREGVIAYLAIIRGEYRLEPSREIPEKFKSLDANGDGYISFDELLLVIDRYFDFELDLDVEEVRELNEFFFSQ